MKQRSFLLVSRRDNLCPQARGPRYSVGRPKQQAETPKHRSAHGREPPPRLLLLLVVVVVVVVLPVGVAVLLALGALRRSAWRPRRLSVEGRSMAPALLPGDRVLVWPVRRVRPGDIVGATDPRPGGRLVVKRVASMRPHGVVLLGDNPDESTDSRHFGAVPTSSVMGRVVYRYAPAGRVGRL